MGRKLLKNQELNRSILKSVMLLIWIAASLAFAILAFLNLLGNSTGTLEVAASVFASALLPSVALSYTLLQRPGWFPVCVRPQVNWHDKDGSVEVKLGRIRATTLFLPISLGLLGTGYTAALGQYSGSAISTPLGVALVATGVLTLPGVTAQTSVLIEDRKVSFRQSVSGIEYEAYTDYLDALDVTKEERNTVVIKAPTRTFRALFNTPLQEGFPKSITIADFAVESEGAASTVRIRMLSDIIVESILKRQS